MALRALTRPRRSVLVVAAVVVVFTVALVAWVAGPDDKHPTLSPGARHALYGAALPSASAAPASGTGTPSGSASAPSSAGAAASGTALDPAATLKPLPESTTLEGAGPPARSVRLTIKSDAAIIRMGYLLKGGHPDRYLRRNVQSPAVVTTVAHGYGLVAQLSAQASPYATYITCTVSVDGKVHSRRTAHGAWAVTVCVG